MTDEATDRRIGESTVPLAELRDDPARAARILRPVLIGLLVLVLVSFSVSPWVGRNLVRSTLFHLGFSATLVASLLLLRAGRVRATGAVVAGSFWSLCSVYMFLVDGVRSPVTFVFLPTVLIAGLFWSWRGATGLAAASVVAALIAAALQEAGILLPAERPPTVWRMWMTLATCTAATTALLYVSLRVHADAIAERALLRERLHEAERLEAIGTLAGGIAHDFNNLLTAVIGNLALLDRRIDDPKAQKSIDACQAAADRAERLVKQLLAVGRRQALHPVVVDLGTLVEESRPLLESLASESVAITVETTPGIDPIRVDPDQVTQVLMNLVVNAKDAMPEGGELRLRTRQEELDADRARTHALEPGPYVVLSVNDTGDGMDEETRRRAFEPFFTTKAVGRGSGLGLATVHGIVAQSGGQVVIRSEMGRGTRIDVLLPAVESDEPPKP